MSALDAGRSQAILLRLPDGRSVLWFGAPPNSSPSVIRREVVPALLHQQVEFLHGVIAANDTQATAKGLMSLVRSFEVLRIWVADGAEARWPPSLRDPLFQGLDLPVKSLRSGWTESCGQSCKLSVLWPEPGSGRSGKGRVKSPVVAIRKGRHSVLLTGDSSFGVERALIPRLDGLRTTVLQVPKAGSRYASSGCFLRQVAPEQAILAARAPKSWQDDVERTLARYRRMDISLWRVDRDGAVTWWTDGQMDSITAVRANVEGFRSPHPSWARARDRSR